MENRLLEKLKNVGVACVKYDEISDLSQKDAAIDTPAKTMAELLAAL